MVKKARKNQNLLGKLLKRHAADETEYSREFIDLPTGISGGIAKLVETKLGVYKPGTKYAGGQFIYLAGVVVEPKIAPRLVRAWKDGKVIVVLSDEVEVEGQRTGKTLPLCATTNAKGEPTSDDENVEVALNEVRKVGGEECTAEVDSEESLVEVLDALKEEGIFFRFSTSSGTPTADYPTERVWENWHGSKGIQDYVQDAESDTEVDDAGEEDEDDTEETAEQDLTLKQLAEIADAGDEKTGEKLVALAAEQDIDPDDYPTWVDLAEALEEDSDKDAEETAEGDDWVPEKGEIWNYKPPKAKKSVECEVTAVFEGKRTCNLKNLDTGKPYKGAPWDKLEGDEE